MKKVLIAIVVVIVLIAGALMGTYNGLVSANENVTSQWSQVENQLQRRNDLIPNLVNTVKGYAAQESKIFTDVANARAKLAGAKSVADASAANNELDGALSRLLAIAENYPQLKSNTNFLQLQDELAGTENRIAVARRDYNNSVQAFNAKIKSFPTNILAGMFGFTPHDYFKADEQAKQVPQVKF
ncbi:MAG: LemA family protein [Acidaminococcus sp.]|jgi:LemA protein|nr:LemA family protein [Acidaminococcus sp.]MCI2100625.1 LemA family protein [Acidaminococcus sp.]MCI2114946.1 LemA family protein [Acidaminococcus sp.]MCI2116972.1 LemA family protein [Acidaminococcus sp.]